MAIGAKEFGILTFDQLKVLTQHIHSLPDLRRQWQAVVEEKDSNVWRVLTPPRYWSGVYTLSFEKHIALLAALGGMSDRLAEAASSSDPQQSILDALEEDLDTSELPPDFGLTKENREKGVIGAWLGWLHSLESIWHYGVPLNYLVYLVSEGDDDALFKAVRVDRTITSCPPVADRIAKAQIQQDEDFFNKLRNALRGPPKKPNDEYGPLRYVLMALTEDGTLERLSIEERYELLSVELNLYPAKGSDPARSLDQFIRRWAKSFST